MQSVNQKEVLHQESLDWLNEAVKDFRRFIPSIFNLLRLSNAEKFKLYLEWKIKEMNDKIHLDPIKVAKDLGYSVDGEDWCDEEYYPIDSSETTSFIISNHVVEPTTTNVFESAIYSYLRKIQLFDELLIKELKENDTLRISINQEMKKHRHD